MLQKSFYLNSYSRYLDILWEQSPSSDHSFIDHDNYNIPTSSEGAAAHWFEFQIMAKDFTRELINAINTFGLYMNHLKTWCDILSNCNDSKERDALLIEFVDPIAFICLNKPYSIKGQFTYATTHLLHLSNSRKSSCWKDQLVADGGHIDYKILKKVGEGWKNFIPFSQALSAINNEEFRNNTFDFRNKSHHAIPPELEFGITSPVRRTETKDGKVSYRIGGIAPLRVKDSFDHLRLQQQACVNTFSNYWKLMEEQLELWKGLNNTEQPNKSPNVDATNIF